MSQVVLILMVFPSTLRNITQNFLHSTNESCNTETISHPYHARNSLMSIMSQMKPKIFTVVHNVLHHLIPTTFQTVFATKPLPCFTSITVALGRIHLVVLVLLFSLLLNSSSRYSQDSLHPFRKPSAQIFP